VADSFNGFHSQNASFKEGWVLALGVDDAIVLAPVGKDLALLEVSFVVGVAFFTSILLRCFKVLVDGGLCILLNNLSEVRAALTDYILCGVLLGQ